jgi:hypothetical protein
MNRIGRRTLIAMAVIALAAMIWSYWPGGCPALALSLHLNIYVRAGRFHVLWSPESKRRHFPI